MSTSSDSRWMNWLLAAILSGATLAGMAYSVSGFTSAFVAVFGVVWVTVSLISLWLLVWTDTLLEERCLIQPRGMLRSLAPLMISAVAYIMGVWSLMFQANTPPLIAILKIGLMAVAILLPVTYTADAVGRSLKYLENLLRADGFLTSVEEGTVEATDNSTT